MTRKQLEVYTKEVQKRLRFNVSYVSNGMLYTHPLVVDGFKNDLDPDITAGRSLLDPRQPYIAFIDLQDIEPGTVIDPSDVFKKTITDLEEELERKDKALRAAKSIIEDVLNTKKNLPSFESRSKTFIPGLTSFIYKEY